MNTSTQINRVLLGHLYAFGNIYKIDLKVKGICLLYLLEMFSFIKQIY